MNQENKKQLDNIYLHLLDISNSLESHPIPYTFISIEEFNKLPIIELKYVYWFETIQRFHICGLTTLLRLKKWYEAIESAYKSQNYYSFCASLRGGVEACADSWYTLNVCVTTIAENFSNIKLALDRDPNSENKIFISTEIENMLIHYTYGRKLTKDEKSRCKPSHNAETVKTYLNSLKDEKIIKLYSELCQITHPSAYSLSPFFLEISDGEQFVHSTVIDKLLIDNILTEYIDEIINTLTIALGPAFCSLKIINLLFGYKKNHLITDENLLRSLPEYKFWTILEEKIKKS